MLKEWRIICEYYGTHFIEKYIPTEYELKLFKMKSGNYYKITEEKSDIRVIGLQNLIQNMKNPALMDLKLGYKCWGMHIDEPGYELFNNTLDISEEDRNIYIDR